MLKILLTFIKHFYLTVPNLSYLSFLDHYSPIFFSFSMCVSSLLLNDPHIFLFWFLKLCIDLFILFERDLPSIGSLPQIPATARARPGWTQESKVHPGLPCASQQSRYSSTDMLPLQEAGSGGTRHFSKGWRPVNNNCLYLPYVTNSELTGVLRVWFLLADQSYLH